ncbi:MAG: nuclear transport factor 2 family protein [Acidobacteria bacterium]|nr:nuclear transport factor 2 family protein [Acidobacteriota bacterium]
MKTAPWSLCLLAAIATAFPASPPAPSAADADEVAIAAAVDDTIGWFETKDFKRLYDALADDPAFFIFHPDSASTVRGIEAFRAYAKIFDDPEFTYAGHTIRDLRIRRSRAGDTAWFSALLDDCATYHGKKGCWKDCRWTGVLEKRGGRWVVVQMHFSFAEDQVAARRPFWEHALDGVAGLKLEARTAEVVEKDGTPALRLDGLVLIEDLRRADFRAEVEVLAEGACYPGIVFHARDKANYELAYAVPHASGLPDAIQYDPVFRGANTWQLFNGPAYQKTASVPKGTWFTLLVTVREGRARIQVGDQPPLVVETLAHGPGAGGIGLWTYQPAYFRNLRVFPAGEIREKGERPVEPADAVTRWTLPDGAVVTAEPGGVVNLGRFLPPSTEPVRLRRTFTLAEAGEVEIGLGFSDEVALRVDGESVFQGTKRFKGFADLPSRGWVTPGAQTVRKDLPAGTHEIVVEIKASEPFGWGFVLTLKGPGLTLPPLP